MHDSTHPMRTRLRDCLMSDESGPGTSTGDDPSGPRPRTAGDLTEPSQRVPSEWLPEELAAILRHQLNAPLYVDLASLVPDELRQLQSTGTTPDHLGQRFGELLPPPTPPIELLQAVRQMVRRID